MGRWSIPVGRLRGRGDKGVDVSYEEDGKRDEGRESRAGDDEKRGKKRIAMGKGESTDGEKVSMLYTCSPFFSLAVHQRRRFDQQTRPTWAQLCAVAIAIQLNQSKLIGYRLRFIITTRRRPPPRGVCCAAFD